MPLQIFLCGLLRAPVGGQWSELSDYQGLDIRSIGFLIVLVGADVADMGIGQADNLTGIAGIGEDFLITGEAGIENNFAAATGASARRATTKYASVLERQRGWRVSQCGQRFLLQSLPPSVAYAGIAPIRDTGQ